MLCQAALLIPVHRGSLKNRMSGQCTEQGAEGRGCVLVRGCADSGGFLSPAAVSNYNSRQRWRTATAMAGDRAADQMSGRENQSEKKM